MADKHRSVGSTEGLDIVQDLMTQVEECRKLDNNYEDCLIIAYTKDGQGCDAREIELLRDKVQPICPQKNAIILVLPKEFNHLPLDQESTLDYFVFLDKDMEGVFEENEGGGETMKTLNIDKLDEIIKNYQGPNCL